MATLNKRDKELLSRITEASQNGPGFIYAMRPEVAKLVAAGMVEVNSNMQNPENPSEYAVRIKVDNKPESEQVTSIETETETEEQAMTENKTEENVTQPGVVAEQPVDGQAVAPAEAAKKPRKKMPKPLESVQLFDPSQVPDVPAPAGRKGGVGRKSIYPFDTMPVGAAFFVPASEDRPDPVKSLSSTVSTKNRTNEKNGNDARFTAFAAPGTNGEPGAWVKRTA